MDTKLVMLGRYKKTANQSHIINKKKCLIDYHGKRKTYRGQIRMLKLSIVMYSKFNFNPLVRQLASWLYIVLPTGL